VHPIALAKQAPQVGGTSSNYPKTNAMQKPMTFEPDANSGAPFNMTNHIFATVILSM
jgi:hypothetical protein